jgi:hypothetical protein
VHAKYEARRGTHNRLYVRPGTCRRFKGSFHVWAPSTLGYVMKRAPLRAEVRTIYHTSACAREGIRR